MIELSEALTLHQLLIDQFGGRSGLRDQGALEAAIHRPYATFGDVDLYPTPVEKAAALLESILINHPFVDGNKRIAYVLMRLLLMENGWDIRAEFDHKFDFVIRASTGELRFDGIVLWIKAHLIKNCDTV